MARFRLALAALAALSLASAGADDGCRLVPVPKVEHGCYWIPLREPGTGCLSEYVFKCLDPKPRDCPPILPPPQKPGCAYMSIHDDLACIVDFECEPDMCEEVQLPSARAECSTFIPKRDPRGCVQSYTCVPAPPTALPNAEPVAVEAVHVERVIPDDIEFTEFNEAPKIEMLEELDMKKKEKSAKILKDSVIIPGIKTGFGVPFQHLANPVLAPRPAVAVQPVVPLRSVVPLARPALLPRPVVPFFRCPAFFPRRPANSAHCRWRPQKDARGCIRGYECDPIEPRVKCPRAPLKPDIGERCEWIPVLDKNNCILKYECMPVPPEPCPPAPLPPDDHDRCKWVSIKDANNCIMDYECVPIDLPFPAGQVGAGLLGDANPVCCWWAMGGECDKNLAYMRTNCARSCSAPGCSGYSRFACVNTLKAAGCAYPPPL